MIAFRLMLAPALVVCALRVERPQIWLGVMIAAGFVSDVYDGILARRWGTATSALRVADSAVDTVFYAGVLGASLVRHWPVIRERLGLLGVLLVLEATRMVVDGLKYRRMASYHSYASKAWGALLTMATVALLCFERWYWLVTAAIVWGIVCDLEGLAMTALLPKWTHDVKTLRGALMLRQTMLAERKGEG